FGVDVRVYAMGGSRGHGGAGDGDRCSNVERASAATAAGDNRSSGAGRIHPENLADDLVDAESGAEGPRALRDLSQISAESPDARSDGRNDRAAVRRAGATGKIDGAGAVSDRDGAPVRAQGAAVRASDTARWRPPGFARNRAEAAGRDACEPATVDADVGYSAVPVGGRALRGGGLRDGPVPGVCGIRSEGRPESADRAESGAGGARISGGAGMIRSPYDQRRALSLLQ